ncbi:related to polynucleotide adenylyltransferase [Cephalotrichum gorgonifer]|uniref:polynucleotide adenylyltransferase n=1 Tax=Cephalotrichum gorgonifer TaxID=2041049 RepID=A0AAE8MVM8_9PEZI|nr:related to polynucleotide adenylyltransferase [Cephalotrichum gorgonifer]
MDGRTAAAESKHSYPAHWPHNPAGGTTTPTPLSPGSQSETSPGPLSSNIEYFPYFFPQQATFFHQQQLLNYNKLISPGRGGGQPLPPAQVASSPHSQTAPRSRSASKVSNKDHPTGKGTQGGHGNRSASSTEKGHRAAIANNKDKDPLLKMPPKNAELAHPLPARPALPGGAHNPSHSNSVPSTPLQHARNFSFESREPSPNATNSHSPRSAYSETTAHVPPLKQLPPKTGGCPYETAQMNTRRRVPYSIGNEKLDRADLSTIKRRLTEDEERKLATDMRELYDRLLPTPEVEAKRKKLATKLETIFNEEWPGHDIRVHPFGSSGNLLCSDDSDVDICITTDWKELEGVCIIADLLAKRGMEKVVCIAAAKVPIVKIWDPELGLACDMNVNNTVALENTRMVRTYVEIDDRVRQLAMIVKYWTRRRIVNDAGLGGTLSSYTWICLVIVFLQLREVPILPALHQRPHQRRPGKDGAQSAFADDLGQLRGFGKKNKSSVAALLFDFFRFYAYEFDYEKHALSVRLGRLLTKKEKNWHHALNNRLCLEEPFNTSRNLGNTADEYSFKGLHLELRRAFDLISEGKLEECCEQYVFPKEEERVFTQTRRPQPILMRSSSQTHSGRGGRGGPGRGGRHSSNNNYYRGNNASRRSSSSLGYDNGNAMFSPQMGGQDLWYTAPYLSQDLVSAALAMQVQQQDYQFQHFYQTHLRAQAAAYQQSQQHQSSQPQQPRMPGGSSQSQPTSSERSRTNSFDNPPHTAPLRPDMLSQFGLPFHGNHYFPPSHTQPLYGAYPSTPPAPATGPSTEFRRSLHRSSAAPDAGTLAAGSSLRSQSQPASRSVPTVHANSGSLSTSGPTAPNGVSPLPLRNNANGIPIPNFMANETECDESPTINGASDSPPPEDGGHTAHGSSDASGPSRRAANAANGIAFGDLHQAPQGRRRTSTELPQLVLDSAIKRVSRSPSPAVSHSRAFSVGTSPAPSTGGSRNPPRPLVVSGSLLKPAGSSSQHHSTKAASEHQPSEEFGGPAGGSEYGTDNDQTPVPSSATTERSSQSLPEQAPVVVNGTNSAAASSARAYAAAAAVSSSPAGLPGTMDEPSFRDRVSMMSNTYFVPQHFYQADPASTLRYIPSTTRQRVMSRQHSGVIAPLDLAVSDYRASGATAHMDQNLSPVYEGRAPSAPSAPTSRKRDYSSKNDRQAQATKSKDHVVDNTKAGHEKPGDRSQQELKQSSTTRQAHSKTASHGGPQRTSQQGHASSASRSQTAGQEGGTLKEAANSEGGWQKASGKHRKKGGDSKAQPNGLGHGETPPKRDSERKGG